MISEDEIRKLATLARLSLKEEELTSLQHDIGAILGYVDQLKEVSAAGGDERDLGLAHNILRSDADPHAPEMFTAPLMKNAPNTEDGYVKVKKIL